MSYQVVHNTGSRFRIRVPQVASDAEYASKLNQLVKSLDFVTSVGVNPLASSLIVSYDKSVVASAAAQEKIFTCIEQASLAEISLEPIPAETELTSKVDAWGRLGLPAIALGAAILVGPFELSIPFLLIGGLIAGAAVPIVSRAIAGIVDERKYKVDVLDALWITLQTLQGQYVAPALMISLAETGTTVRDLTARAEERQILELLNSGNRSTWVEQDQEALVSQSPSARVANTQVGNSLEEVADRLVVPTLFLSGTIFAVTGNIFPALAPLQLDFGTGLGIAIPTTILAALTYAARCGVFIRNGRVLEVLARTDTVVFSKTKTLLHPESSSAIATLTEQGIKNYLITDDNQQVANAVATQLSIEANNIDGEALPEKKLELVRRLHSEGKTVAYVGDGFSDTEALACASISVSFAEGSDMERETTDVVIIGNDLRRLTHAIDIAKQAMSIVHQNIAIVTVPNISVVVAGVFFGLHPVWAVIINNGAALIAEMNGWRPLLVNSVHQTEPQKKPILFDRRRSGGAEGEGVNSFPSSHMASP